MPIIKEIEDTREGIEFRYYIWLSNGVTGKNITVYIFCDGEKYNIKTPYLITYNGKIFNVITEKEVKPYIPKTGDSDHNLGYDFVLRIRKDDTWKELSKHYKFKKTKKASATFSYDELVKMEDLFKKGFTVREVINEMGWEFDEKNSW